MASLPEADIANDYDEMEVVDEAMDDSELLSILGQHQAQAIGYQPGGDDEISAAQEKAINYYNGVMDDVKAQEGSSAVTDSTVALVVDNALASILKPFVSSDETVSFAPRGPEDVETAEQATEYTNYVFTQDNPGFLILHNWFKDALLTKLGVVKVWWEEQPRLETTQTLAADDLHAQYLRMQPNYLGEEVTEQGVVAFLGEEVEDGRVKVEVVPPEEFRISSLARSDDEVDYIAHVPINTTRSDLIEMGFDPEIIESLPSHAESVTNDGVRRARFDDENITDGRIDSPHSANDRMELRDEYVRIDYNGDGVAEYRRILRVGDVILLNDEVDDHPFATLCPIPMSHKVYGHGLADRVMQEQKIGTVLWRQSLDNLYKSNNPRPVVGEGAIRPDGATQDSLNDNAPGAAILVRDSSQLDFSAVPFTANHTFPMFELLDKKVEENTGIGRAGQGLDTNALRKAGQTTATEISVIQEGKNSRVEMMARIFAETGVTRLFKMILTLVSKHQPRERVIRLRNKWVEMDPRGWPEMDVKVSVGLGIGDKMEQLAQSEAVLQTMADLAATPFAHLIDAEKVYNALKRKFTAAGIKNIDDYLNSPQEMEPQPEQPDPAMMEAQMKAQLDQQKLQGEQALAEQRLQLKAREAELDKQLARDRAEFEAQLAREKAEFEADLAAWKAEREVERKTDLPDNRAGGDLSK